MSTQIAAALARPKTVAVGLALIIGLTIGLAQPATADAAAKPAKANKCRHGSLTKPPKKIRVLRTKTGRIKAVPFKKYVVTVMGKEWPSYLPQSVVEAGAVAVKQYAWYHAVYAKRTYKGRCFDVRDSTADQLYKPSKARVGPDHHRAVKKTWRATLLRKSGKFFMTGYRRGKPVKCGRDATGHKLFAMSAKKCAKKGWGWKKILREYYGPNLRLTA